MIESRLFNFSVGEAPAIGSWRTTLRNESSDFATLHLQRSKHIHRSWNRTQWTSGRKLRIYCNPLRLGAAEEGVSSWGDKLESSSTEKGELLEGDHLHSKQKGTVGEEGVEQEHTRGPSEDKVGSDQQPGEAGMNEGDKGEAVADSVAARKHSAVRKNV